MKNDPCVQRASIKAVELLEQIACNDSTIALPYEHRQLLAAATSENTRRAYQSAIRHFIYWGGTLPCDEATVVRYLIDFAQKLNTRTLALRLTALSQWHKQQGFFDPASTPTTRKTLVGIARTYGVPRKKAAALSLQDLERIATYLGDKRDLKSKRDNALLQLAFFAALRRSEVVSLQIEQLQFSPEGLIFTLVRSKTDQTGQGMTKAIPFGRNICCPTRVLQAWLEAAGIKAGPVFRRINRWGVLSDEALGESSVNSIVSDQARAVGLLATMHLSSHSLRRGLATSAYRAGAKFIDIKRQGGWRHDGTVQGYIEEAGLFVENAAGVLLSK
jgi:integrase